MFQKNTKFTTYDTHNLFESWALQLWDSMIKVHMMHIDLYLVELGRLWLKISSSFFMPQPLC
jgi:hypothetical protein